MEGVDSLYTEEPEEQQTEEQQQPFQLAVIATVEEDGLTLTPDGAEEPTEKHFKCNTGINFAAGQRVAVLELSGSKVVMFPIGNPGADAPAKIPPGGTAGQVLKNRPTKTTRSHGAASPASCRPEERADRSSKSQATTTTPSNGATSTVLCLPAERQARCSKIQRHRLRRHLGQPRRHPADRRHRWSGPAQKRREQLRRQVGQHHRRAPNRRDIRPGAEKSSATNYACTWGNVDGTLPSGGTDGQVLLKTARATTPRSGARYPPQNSRAGTIRWS